MNFGKRIAIYAGVGRNAGDHAILNGMKYLLQSHTDRPLDFLPINSDIPISRQDQILPAPFLDVPYVEYLNKTCDMLIWGAGGQIMSRDISQSVSGYQFNVSYSALEALKIPLVAFSIGYNKFPTEPDFIDKCAGHLRTVKKKSSLFSVRNQFTADVLKSIDISSEITPDPAIFAPRIPLEIPALSDNPFTIGLNWAGDAQEKRFKDNTEALVTITSVAALIKSLAEKTGQNAKILYIPHCVNYDFDIIPLLKAVFGNNFVSLYDEAPWLYPESDITNPFLVDAYHQCDVVFGMRGHANIIPFGQRVPAYGYGNQAKVKAFQDSIGGKVIGQDLIGMFNTICDEVLINRNDTLDRIDSELSKQRVIMSNFIGKILALLE